MLITKEFIDGLQREERECIKPRAGDADCAYADVDTLVGSFESAGGEEMAAALPCGVERYRWQKWRSPTNGVGNIDGDGAI